jgi:hypothetical protein
LARRRDWIGVADVDHDCAGSYLIGKVSWFDSFQAGSGSREEPVNGRLVLHGMPPRSVEK